ncbi:MAG TPA: Hsp20/alpha crystallin family protein [Nitrospira sp.]|nr:Hsp20/alpha crystallin family protein [Candidatus Nomurabacteria bacterium]HNP80354.1 Hsp20/alpha crystallin family protein [Nitrospira sp.]
MPRTSSNIASEDPCPLAAVDVYEEKDSDVSKAETPSLAKEDISVQLTDSTLTIKGEKKREEEVKEDDYYRCERSFGPSPGR